MQIDKSQVQWDDAPAIDTSKVQWDAEPKPKTSLVSTRGFKDAGDLALAGLSNLIVAPTVSGLAGIWATLAGRDPVSARESAVSRFVYHTQPNSDARAIADKATSGIGRVAQPISEAMEQGYTGIGRMAGAPSEQAVRDAVGTIGDIAGVLPLVGAGTRAVRIAGLAKKSATANSAVARTPIEIAEAAGFRIAPSSVQDAGNVGTKPSLTARVLESAGDPYKISSDNIRHNKNIANDIAIRELGLKPGTPLSEKALSEAARPHAAVYDEVRKNVKALPITPELSRAVAIAGRGTDSVLPLPASVDVLKESLLSRPMNGSQLLDTISDLRMKGWKGINAKENPDANAVGSAQLDMANALEAHLEQATRTTNPGLANRYRNARTGFAKIETVKRAMVGNDINPQALRKAAAKTDAIDGGLKIIADTAEFFPSDMQVIVPKRSEIGRSVHAALAFGSLGVIPLAQGGLAKLVGATRGESAIPQLGLGGPLSYNYRGPSGSPFPPRGNLIPESDPRRLLPGPSAVSKPVAGVNVNRTVPVGSESLNAADRARYGVMGDVPSLQHPGQARSTPPLLGLPAPGRSSAPINVAESFRGRTRQAALQHPGTGDNPVPSTVTAARQKAIIDHYIQVLSRQRKGLFGE